MDEVKQEGTWFDRTWCICNNICVFDIEFARSVEKDLSGFRVFDRNRSLKAIEEQLSRDPCVETRNRKALVNLIPPFEAVPPVWELRIGDYRIFYDVDEDEGIVCVRAVRQKPPHKTTEEIL
jgi:mRNA-degrading endonuclease RelE of RelBE toxin-antitoxin system